jgi:A118 family predicted phage portal protein
MPLPSAGQSWPPPNMMQILPHLGMWSAWYSGDSDQLSSVYGGATGSDPSATGIFASDHGGFRATVGRALTRWFWGEATRGPDRRTKLHVPIGAELCQASADLLFADELELTIDGTTRQKENATQLRLDQLAGDGLYNELAEGAELSAALGGVYEKVTWDDRVDPDGPFITHVDADQALPEFQMGRLMAVTFWHVVARDGKKVFRHLERHELASNGNGVILHGLYLGEETLLGYQVPLNVQPATSALMGAGEAFGFTQVIDSMSPGLCVVYVPNQTPNRVWRTDAIGRHLGRSDLDGIEQLMDALDETYSSWMRAIRLSKARVMVAKTLLDNVGPGNGRAFDAEQEIFSPINTLGGKDQPLAQQMQFIQPGIDFVAYQTTSMALVEQIIQAAGYSAETLGVYAGGGPTRTATEVEAKQQRSLLTRDRKMRLWRPAIKDLLEKLLAVDRDFFGTPNQFAEVDVAFPDTVQESQLSLAQTAQALFAGQTASTEVRVQMMHPDWDDDDVAQEVALIQKENNVTPESMLPPDFNNLMGQPSGPPAGGMSVADQLRP